MSHGEDFKFRKAKFFFLLSSLEFESVVCCVILFRGFSDAGGDLFAS